MKKRAFSQEDKNSKRDKIMMAAMDLLQEGKFALPSVNEIIQKASEAKGTVYLYFQSKEEIYLSVLGTELNKATQGLLQNLQQNSQQSRGSTPQIISEALIKFARSSAKITYLAVIAPIVLENNVSDEFVVALKASFLSMTEQIAEAVHKRDGLAKKQAKEKFLIAYNLFIGMYQHSHPPRHVQELMEKNNLLELQYNFEKKYTEILKKIWN